jgi:hypothetical protein
MLNAALLDGRYKDGSEIVSLTRRLPFTQTFLVLISVTLS